MYAEPVLKRFNNTTLERDESPSSEPEGDGSIMRQLHDLFDNAVKDTAAVEAKKLSDSLHSLQVQNELLHYKNKGLRTILSTKQKLKKKNKPLDL